MGYKNLLFFCAAICSFVDTIFDESKSATFGHNCNLAQSISQHVTVEQEPEAIAQ